MSDDRGLLRVMQCEGETQTGRRCRKAAIIGMRMCACHVDPYLRMAHFIVNQLKDGPKKPKEIIRAPNGERGRSALTATAKRNALAWAENEGLVTYDVSTNLWSLVE